MGKTAVVTGASGKLGGEIAVGLARAGCDVVLHFNKNAQAVERIALRVREIGRKAGVVQLDLLSVARSEPPAFADELFRHHDGFGPVRILVNSAARFGRTPVGSIDAKQATLISAMDMLVPILLAQEFAARVMSEDKEKSEIRNPKIETDPNDRNAKVQNEEAGPWGKIVNIVDVGGERPWKGYSVYCAAKAGLIAATKSLAKELAPGITVNAVAPGLVTWPEGMDEAGKARQLGFIPAGRVARAEEVAAAVVFLLQNDYITGQVLNVDGGRAI